MAPGPYTLNSCRWDSWLLDVAVCNLAGIWIGMATVRWFECKYERYNWQVRARGTGCRVRGVRGIRSGLQGTGWLGHQV